jgi:hypothetical protein
MSMIAFVSAKGSPGVTTTVAALAATWPTHRRLTIVEVDPSGGDFAVRFDLAAEPGLVSLAAAGRRELDGDTVAAHMQPLPATAERAAESDPRAERRVLVGPVAAEQAHAALLALRGRLGDALADLDGDVLADCGRLDPNSPALEVVSRSELVVAVVRPVVAEIHHLQTRLAALRLPAVSLLMVGDRPYSVVDVAEIVGADPLGALPDDRRAALALAGTHADGLRVLRRSPLVRTAGAVAQGITRWISPESSPAPAPAVAAPVDATGAASGARSTDESQSPRSPRASVPPPPNGVWTPAPPRPSVPPPPNGAWAPPPRRARHTDESSAPNGDRAHVPTLPEIT